jgi:uncharacterized protein (TIGR01244 family)
MQVLPSLVRISHRARAARAPASHSGTRIEGGQHDDASLLRNGTLLAVAAVAACTSTPRIVVPDLPYAAVPAPGIVSAGRLSASDVASLRADGIRGVIDLTPDAETPGFDEARAVDAEGLAYANLPLRGPADLTRENVWRFDELLAAAPRPLLVHCASSNRVGAMAALRAAWIEGRSTEDALAIGRTWGLKGLEPAVRERLDASRCAGGAGGFETSIGECAAR